MILLIAAGAANAAPDRLLLRAENHDTYGRLILTFPSRFDLPAYSLKADNGVLTIVFTNPVDVNLPDVSGSLTKYITIARLDPDKGGIRLGLKNEFRISHIEAGEKLFIDILPKDWQGITPGLPPEVIAELSRRSADAAVAAEKKRKAEAVIEKRPHATIQVGRHPSFTRVRILWSEDTLGQYDFADGVGTVKFDWPVPIDLYALNIETIDGLAQATNKVDEDATTITLAAAEGTVPRFYSESKREFILDLDMPGKHNDQVDLASLLPEGTPPPELNAPHGVDGDGAVTDAKDAPPGTAPQISLTPAIEISGETVRVQFPFEHDTPAAVFRRGDVVWLVFDTTVAIANPAASDALSAISDQFTVVASGGTTIVRMHLIKDRLATLGSEGRSWVLSLGDLLLSPNEAMSLTREQDEHGLFRMSVDVARPSMIHEIRDPDVGDVLDVVTLFPPARGLVRDLSYVDFSALSSVHGLVIKPQHDDVRVTLDDKKVEITADRGLILSSQQGARGTDSRQADSQRSGFIDLSALEEKNPVALRTHEQEIMTRAASAEKRSLDTTRMELAHFYLANDLSYEALGILDVVERDLTGNQFKADIAIARGAAETMAGRGADALKILDDPNMANSVDALLWRTIARTEQGDFVGARTDSLVAESIFHSYPVWTQEKFLMAAAEAAIETGDISTARRMLGSIQTSYLAADSLSHFKILSARIDEAEDKPDEALDIYGQVIAADIRPARAEAVYRTMEVLDRMGRLDAKLAAETLAGELTLWRGDELEAKMMQLQADLYFRNSDFREGFETVRSMAEVHPDSAPTATMLQKAKTLFSQLYLDGEADALDPIPALTLYYDFRGFTPAGTRGDEMVRNLARRLIKVDLLDQAADLLQYQIDNRLEGAARAQVAADLAIVYLAHRQPQKSLKALNDTRIEGLPPALARQRRLLEAKALIDSGREDLALEIMSTMDGNDTNLMRIDALWQTKRYREASEILEVMYAPTSLASSLTDIARNGIVRSAVGYVLGNDMIGLSRLRQKYSEAMAQSPQWPLFNLVTGKAQVTSLEFQKVAAQVADVDSLKQFLSSYREIYGVEGALMPNV